jgi:hypothetical protein
MKELEDGVWEEILSSPAESKSWAPSQTEGSCLFIQTGQGKYLKYIFEDGRYNLVGTVE